MAAKTEKIPLATQLRELLAQTTADDVKDLDAQILAKQAELDALKADRKMLAQAAGIEEPKKHWTQTRKAKAAPSANGATTERTVGQSVYDSYDLAPRRKQLLAWLAANGSKHIDKVSGGTGIPLQGPGCVSHCIKGCDWFHLDPERYVSLTDKGERQGKA